MSRIDFTPANFVKLIEEKGCSLVHERAMLCHCLSVDTGMPDPNCVFCNHGYNYWGEETIRGVMIGVTTAKDSLETGLLSSGTVSLTVNGNVRIGYRDRFTNRDARIVHYETVVREASGPDQLRYLPVEVERLVGEGNTGYDAPLDYTLNGRLLTWKAGRGPVAGTRYGISYVTHPVWLVISQAHAIRETQLKFRRPEAISAFLPLQALLRLEWLVEE